MMDNPCDTGCSNCKPRFPCLSASRWRRCGFGGEHSDVGLYTTSPYEHAVQHSIGFESSNGRILLELKNNYSPSLPESNNWSGFREAFDEKWGMYRRSDLMETAEPWPPWGEYGGTPMKSGFSFRYWRDASLCQRSVWIPYWFLVVLAAILPAAWGWRR